MHKIIASLLAVVVTTLSITIMAALVDDSKLTAQQVGQYRDDNFVVVDDVFDFGVSDTWIIHCKCRWRPEPFERSKFQVKTLSRIEVLIPEQSPIIGLLKLSNDLKSSLIF